MVYDEIMEIANKKEREKKLKEWYSKKLKVSKWLNSPPQNRIIVYKDRTEYTKNGEYHRLNGPAIEYKGYNNQTTEDAYYYNGEKYEDKEMWLAATRKELRKLKIRNLESKK